MKKISLLLSKNSFFLLVLVITFLLISISSATYAQKEPVFVLEDMDSALILGQRAKVSWGHFWSGPTVSAINFGYLAEHGFQKLANDRNGNGEIEAGDLEPLAEELGTEYMDTISEEGTADPNLVKGIARYVGENYPDRFELKIYEDNFTKEYKKVTGEGLPESISDVRVRTLTDPEFKVYEKELRGGEMIWLGLPQENSPFNHYLAGRSLDIRKTMGGNYPVDFGEPKEKSFQPGKGQIIETVMSENGDLEYGGRMRPVDIMIALSPLDEEPETGKASNKPDLECNLDCQQQTKEVCVEYERDEPECRTKCAARDGQQCYEWEEVCEEGDRVCVESISKEVLVCDAKVKNTGGTESGLNTGRLSAGDEDKPFLTTPLAPGEDQSAGKVTLGLEEYRAEDLTCRVDIYDDVSEANEENNESKATG